MTSSAWQCFWVWFCSLSRAGRVAVHALWATQLVAVALVLVAPHAWASGMDAVVGFTGVHDSYGVPLTNNRFINGDDSIFDWNGVLPRIRAGASISTGITNAIGEAEVGLIVVSVSLCLWLIQALRSASFSSKP